MPPLLRAQHVSATRDGRTVLDDVSLDVLPGQHWALLGPNGAGKSTLLGMLGGWRFPSGGSVELLGTRLGTGDLRELRRGVGWVDPTLAVRPVLTVTDVVLTGATATTELLPRRTVPAAERARAAELLTLMGVERLADHAYGTLSAGERGRTLVARALLTDPALLLLDEPFTGLDLPGRELLRDALDQLDRARTDIASVLVTHHLEELPAGTTHAALLRTGRLIDSGPVHGVLTSARLSDCFGLPLTVRVEAGRWQAASALSARSRG